MEKDKDGYFAFSPDLKGCCTQGESYEEVIKNILVKKGTEQTLLVIIPRKRIVPKGMLNAILQQAAPSRDEFLSLLKQK